MTLSVVSALARLGCDPWREAARLAGLPKPQAAAALVGLFGRLPDAAGRHYDTAAQAARLIGLLPASPAAPAVVSPGAPRGSPSARRSRLGFGAICVILLLAALATTIASQNLLSRDAAPPTPISARP
ncbi:MAG: hypothetical protein HY060_11035 [Proteobacteria bacterium]|nr:hypothetical protein [Pseudomonadota bacterium]